MVKHRFINDLCIAVIVAAMAFTALFSYSPLLGVAKAETTLKYADKLFDDSSVHSLDISIGEDDWSELIAEASTKEYTLCTVTIDGESFESAAIRAKGNTSLSSVSSMGGERYSFKVEFDHYQNGLTYYGLDKLSLNNLIFDKTYLKDYLVYDMMDYMGVDTPLASFVLMTVNGEPWGLYLAVEGVEEAFAERNYGSGYSGELYKPDSMSAGADGEADDSAAAGGSLTMPGGGQMPDRNGGFTPPDGMELPNFGKQQGDASGTQPSAPDTSGAAQTFPGAAQPETSGGETAQGGGRGTQFGGSSDDVALVYSDESFSSYAHIFSGAIFDDVTDVDKRRLIASLKQLNEGENLEEVLDVEEVLKYFVVHNFSLNFDSYTGSLMHNYYLYEENGQLSMIPWDYNLAFGTFNMGGAGVSGDGDATSLINYPIDTPTSGATLENRPLLAALLQNEAYLAQYHAFFDEFISGYFESGRFEELMERVVALIGPYVSEDATAFYSYDEFITGADTLKEFCLLRAKSIRGQLDGIIPATSAGQSTDASSLVDGSALTVSDMGSMSGMGGGARNTNAQGGFTRPGNMGQNTSDSTEESAPQPGSADGSASWGGTALWWLTGSGVLLLAGLLFAIFFKRRRT